MISDPFTLIFSTKSANLKGKGVQIDFFPLCIAFRKVIFLIYQKIYLSDRVPLSFTIFRGDRLCCKKYYARRRMIVSNILFLMLMFLFFLCYQSSIFLA